MQTKTSGRFQWLNMVALLLILPATCFIGISVLKYNFGVNGPYDFIGPFFENRDSQEPLGWNINLLILSGPIIAIVMALLQVLTIEWNISKEQFRFQFTVQKRWIPLTLISISGLALASLFFYLVGENGNLPIILAYENDIINS